MSTSYLLLRTYNDNNNNNYNNNNNNNNNNNKCIPRVPFHVKHLQLRRTGAIIKHVHISHSKQHVSKQSCSNIPLSSKDGLGASDSPSSSFLSLGFFGVLSIWFLLLLLRLLLAPAPPPSTPFFGEVRKAGGGGGGPLSDRILSPLQFGEKRFLSNWSEAHTQASELVGQ